VSALDELVQVALYSSGGETYELADRARAEIRAEMAEQIAQALEATYARLMAPGLMIGAQIAREEGAKP
jgi:siroheme synthase (precorrin-2 oxidase/ferrochelatase)